MSTCSTSPVVRAVRRTVYGDDCKIYGDLTGTGSRIRAVYSAAGSLDGTVRVHVAI